MENILTVKSVHDYNTFVGHADQHPLVSVIEFTRLSQFFRCPCHFRVSPYSYTTLPCRISCMAIALTNIRQAP